MSKLLLKFFVGLLLAGLPVFQGRAVDTNSVAALVQGNNTFGCELYQALRPAPGNLLFSPLSISSSLALLYAGAKGETATQIGQSLHFPTDQPTTVAAFGQLQPALLAFNQTNHFDLNLSLANGLWGQTGHPFLPAYLQMAQTHFAARLEQADFKTEAESARRTINQWVSDNTHQKINDLFPKGSINGASRLVIANAIYFKGNWTSPFQSNQTQNAPFHVSSATTKTIQVPLMHQTAHFNYGETPDCQLLELPYASELPGVSMVILLPKTLDGIASLEKKISATNLTVWLEKAAGTEVEIFLPRFKGTSQFTLNQTLADLGIIRAFSPRANFSGMDGANDLFLSTVVHKAYIDVNEQGTEAAAATGVTMRASAVMRHRVPPTFRADHPFLYLIREQATGSILFLGRLANPTL